MSNENVLGVAAEVMNKHRLEPKPDAEATSKDDCAHGISVNKHCQFCASMGAHIERCAATLPSAQPKPDAAGETKDDGAYEAWLAQYADDEEDMRHISHIHGYRMRAAFDAGRTLSAPRNPDLAAARERDQAQAQQEPKGIQCIWCGWKTEKVADYSRIETVLFPQMQKHICEDCEYGPFVWARCKMDKLAADLDAERESHRKLAAAAKEMAEALEQVANREGYCVWCERNRPFHHKYCAVAAALASYRAMGITNQPKEQQ